MSRRAKCGGGVDWLKKGDGQKNTLGNWAIRPSKGSETKADHDLQRGVLGENPPAPRGGLTAWAGGLIWLMDQQKMGKKKNQSVKNTRTKKTGEEKEEGDSEVPGTNRSK